MANGPTLYCRPSDIITDQATISLTVGAVNAAFPLTNIQDGIPSKPTKTTGVTATFRATFGGAVTLEMVSFGPHNLAGVSAVALQNGAGFNQAITVPANRENGLSISPFLDFSTLANRTSTTWDLVVTTALANIAIGEWQLITTKRTMPIRLGRIDAIIQPSIVKTTSHGVKWKYSFEEEQQRISGRVSKESERLAILSLIRSAKGQYKNFLVVPDSLVNEAILCDLNSDEHSFTRNAPLASEIELEFLEVQRGVAL